MGSTAALLVFVDVCLKKVILRPLLNRWTHSVEVVALVVCVNFWVRRASSAACVSIIGGAAGVA